RDCLGTHPLDDDRRRGDVADRLGSARDGGAAGPRHWDVTPLGLHIRRCMIMGGFLIGLSLFEAEWEFGVPQFRMVLQPLLIAVAAGCALVAARVWIGVGGALSSLGFYFGLRGLVSVIVGLFFVKPIPTIPLFLVEALCVELAALLLAR